MTMENVNVNERAKQVVSELLGKKSANVADIRQNLTEFGELVFNKVKDIMEENSPTLEYGCSETDGRFWLVD